MHPAVVMARKQIQQTCATHQIPVCVCGELAGDPIGALLLMGLGYTTLSMNTSNVAKMKYLVRHSELAELTQLAEQALTQPYGREIYNMMLAYIENTVLQVLSVQAKQKPNVNIELLAILLLLGQWWVGLLAYWALVAAYKWSPLYCFTALCLHLDRDCDAACAGHIVSDDHTHIRLIGAKPSKAG